MIPWKTQKEVVTLVSEPAIKVGDVILFNIKDVNKRRLGKVNRVGNDIFSIENSFAVDSGYDSIANTFRGANDYYFDETQLIAIFR